MRRRSQVKPSCPDDGKFMLVEEKVIKSVPIVVKPPPQFVLINNNLGLHFFAIALWKEENKFSSWFWFFHVFFNERGVSRLHPLTAVTEHCSCTPVPGRLVCSGRFLGLGL